MINDQAGIQALEELVTAKRYSDKKVVRWWTTSAKDFAEGKLAMMINFSNYASEILGSGSRVVGNIGVAMVPGRNPIYGGGTIGISKNSSCKQDALAFIKWLTSDPVASGMAALEVFLPVSKHTVNTILLMFFHGWSCQRIVSANLILRGFRQILTGHLMRPSF